MCDAARELGLLELACHPGLFSSDSFKELPVALQRIGWRIVISDSGIEAPAGSLISFNGVGFGERIAEERRKILVILEPTATLPSLPHLVERADHSFAASQWWASRFGASGFLWPQDLASVDCPTESGPFLATLVAANKRSASLESRYGLRRRVIHLADVLGIPLAVVGPGWDSTAGIRFVHGARQVLRQTRWHQPVSLREAFGEMRHTPKHYQGWTETKASAFRLAPATIVIENSPDYVSEKLVDAIRHGITPIFVGPPLGEFGFPENIAICVEPRAAEVVDTLANLDPGIHSSVRAAGQEWLLSQSARRHAGAEVMRQLAIDITRVSQHQP